MKLLKNQILLIVLALAISFFTASYVFIRVDLSSFNFEIEDVSGDRSLLNEVEIGGVVADELHRYNFTVENGIWKTSLKKSSSSYINQFNDILPANQPIRIIESIEISSDAQTYTNRNGEYIETYMDKADLFFNVTDIYINNRQRANFTFKTGVVRNSPNKEIYITRPVNAVETYVSSWGSSGGEFGLSSHDQYLVRHLKGRVFVFTNTGRDCKGIGGAYEITDQLKPTLFKSTKQSMEAGFVDIKNIAPIDLDEGNVRILGMETIADQLVFLTLREYNVVLKPFSLKDNKFLSDIDLGVLNYSEHINNVQYFTSQNDGVISFAIKSDEAIIEGCEYEFFVYDSKKSKVLLRCEDSVSPLQGNTDSMEMNYKNGKLFVLLRYLENALYKYSYGGVINHDVRISVYRENKILYKGLIKTNIPDDRQFQGGIHNQFAKRLYFRDFYNLTIK